MRDPLCYGKVNGTMDGRQLLTEHIEQRRKLNERGVQAKIASAANVSQSQLSLYLKGKRELSLSKAAGISAATGIPIQALAPKKLAEAESALEAAQ